MHRPSLNVDAGEGPAEDPALLTRADLLNVACGGHAGDEALTRKTLRLARDAGLGVGAHPSFPDRERFGRVVVELPLEDLRASLVSQLAWLRRLADDVGVSVGHMKPHGALYHAANQRPELAEAVLDATRATLGLVTVIGPPGGLLRDGALLRRMAFLREGFADRGYAPDGETLVPRGTLGALLEAPHEAVAQAQRLVASGRVETLCVHADTPAAMAIATAVRQWLETL